MNTIDYTVIEQRKIQLITMITQLYDIDLLDAIEEILLNNKKDWWHTISDAEKKAIDIGLDDIKHGRVISHEQAMAKIENRYKDLL